MAWTPKVVSKFLQQGVWTVQVEYSNGVDAPIVKSYQGKSVDLEWLKFQVRQEIKALNLAYNSDLLQVNDGDVVDTTEAPPPTPVETEEDLYRLRRSRLRILKQAEIDGVPFNNSANIIANLQSQISAVPNAKRAEWEGLI